MCQGTWWRSSSTTSPIRGFAPPDARGEGVEVRDLCTGAVVQRWPGDLGAPSTLLTLPRLHVARVTAAKVMVLGP